MAHELAEEGGYHNPSPELIVREVQRYAEAVEGPGQRTAGVAPLPRITPMRVSYIEPGYEFPIMLKLLFAKPLQLRF